MRKQLLEALALSALLFVCPASGHASLASERPSLPNFDKRATQAQGGEVVSGEQQAAAAQLRTLLPQARVDFDPVTGAPKMVAATDGFLSGANGMGKAVSAAAASGIAANDPYRATKAFLKDHSKLFGYGPEALGQARITREYVTPHNGLRTVVWEQQVAGVAVFEAVLISHTTSKGELVNVCSQFLPDPVQAAGQGTSTGATAAGAAGISAWQAVGLAARNVGEDLAEEKIRPSSEPATDAEQRQKFTAPGLRGEADAKLIWLPMDKRTLRSCWDVVLMSRSRGEMFRTLVDARTGEVLLRRCLTSYLTDASYRVFTSDSPTPLSPGYSTPTSMQPSLVARTLVTLSALDTNASPAGWINEGDNQTLGNNVDAHTDWNADDLPDLPRPQGSPFRVFDFPMDLASQDPTNYASAAVVQLFYLCNWYHDRLYQLGFTEAAGNFQTDNFGRGGLGNDAVQADAQDGSGFNNANFSTPPDGSPGRMQMYIFNGPSPRRDGDFDAEVVLHEHTHGLSWRLVGGGQALGDTQSDGMGEGWSDFYALSLLSEAGDDVNGNYAAGAYASYELGWVGDTENYYFGIRRYPYTTDMSRNPLTFKDIDPAQADYCSSGAPYHTGMFGNCSAADADEVHHEGEVWCVTLWQARVNLINKYGWVVGNQLILQLVTDGMKLTPPHPNFLQARDAILQADLVDTGGANQNDLWAAFTKRGMGFSATSPSSSTTIGVHESFDLPDDLRIAPLAGFVASGPVGGPFIPNTMTFVLTNVGSNSLTWAAANTNTWLSISPTGGTLSPGGPAGSITATVTAANSLPMGVYPATVWFTNLDSQVGQSRQFTLRVGQADFYTKLFDTGMTSLSFQAFTFTPDGSSSFYAVCRQVVAGFFTDPTGGTPVPLSDDSCAAATVTGGNAIAIYNTRSSVFYIGSNGYLTMNSGDTDMVESYTSHFSLPRVAALFHDLNPGAGGAVSWKQLADRVAVTYQAVPVYGLPSQTNSFQVELFFDGRIRITYLAINTPGALVGLSAGTGVPANFLPSDFSSYGACSPLAVVLPASAVENAGVLANAGSVWVPSALLTNFTVSLSSSVPSRLTVPATAIVPAGQTYGTFDLTVVDNNVHDGDQLVTITASAPGYTNVSSTLLVVDDDTPPQILIQPASRTVGVSNSVTFNLTVSGKSPYYFWQRNGHPIDGATASSYTTNDVQLADSGDLFSCLVSNAYGLAVSSSAVLTVIVGETNDQCSGAIVISTPAYSNTQSTTDATSTGDPTPSCDSDFGNGVWYQYTAPGNGLLAVDTYGSSFDTVLALYSGSCGALAELACNDDNGGTYQSSITSSVAAGTTYYVLAGGYDALSGSLVLHLTFAAAPAIVTQPQPSTVSIQLGGNATFAVVASGDPPLSYLWRKGGVPLSDGGRLSGTTTPSLTISNLVMSDAGQYSVLVANAIGSVLSSNATLSVTLPVIQMERYGSELLMIWPAAFQGFVMESCTNLSPTNWLALPYPPVQIGDEMIVPIALSEKKRFYRLHYVP
jgi:hypothetical protein